MSSLRPMILALLAVLAGALPASAEQRALARVDAEASTLADAGTGVALDLALSERVPWRVFLLDEPRRLVIDLLSVAWSGSVPVSTERVGSPELARFDADWTRLTFALAEPLVVEASSMEAGDDGVRLQVQLAPVLPEVFKAQAGAPVAVTQPPVLRAELGARAPGDPLRVMLDPGHGGFDPGAEAGGLVEADLMLSFARALQDVLRESGFAVALTREADVFVSLEARMSAARAFGADLLLSLHADALPEDAGNASGATVYTLSGAASAEASQRLVERHGKDDLIAGLDLGGHEEDVSLVLMDLARRETAPRSVVLAQTLLDHIRAGTGHVSGRPQRVADFSVLRAPDFPSVLLELGFLSSRTDRTRLSDAAWRQRTAEAIRDGLRAWSEAERAGSLK